jgi:hypothetical protein
VRVEDACTAVGYCFTNRGSLTLAERWNGTDWAIQRTPNAKNSAFHGVCHLERCVGL